METTSTLVTAPYPSGATTVDAATLAGRLGRHEPVTVLDVRRPDRWAEDRESIPGAVWLPHDQVARRSVAAHDRDLVVYCSWAAEATSARVARWLLAHGFSRVAVLRGGLAGWRQAGLTTQPLVGNDSAPVEADGRPPSLAVCSIPPSRCRPLTASS
jgi:rhodanese-related sulfurtransferase